MSRFLAPRPPGLTDFSIMQNDTKHVNLRPSLCFSNILLSHAEGFSSYRAVIGATCGFLQYKSHGWSYKWDSGPGAVHDVVPKTLWSELKRQEVQT